MAIHGIASIAIAHAGAVMVWTIGEILEAPTKSAIVAQMARSRRARLSRHAS
jgi:hypothetical protein